MFPGVEAQKNKEQSFLQWFIVSWPLYIIAGLGLLINITYFTIDYVTYGRSFPEHFWINFYEHAFIISLLVIIPGVAFLAYRVLAGHQLNEYHRRLEFAIEAKTKQLEELMNFSEKIMDSVNDLIFAIGPDGRFQFVSGNCRDMLGCEPDAIIGRQFIDIIAPGSVALALRNFESILRGNDIPAYELEVTNADGSTKFIEISGTAYIQGERINCQVGVARDITERKGLEQHVIERNRELAALNAVAGAVGQSLDLDQILNAALDQVSGLLKSDQACFYLHDEQNNELVLRLSRGVICESEKIIDRIELGQSFIGRAVVEGRPIILDGSEDFSEMTLFKNPEEVTTAAAIPMKYSGRLIGVLAVASREVEPFSRADIDLLRLVSSQVAMSVENALLFEELTNKKNELELQNKDLAQATEKISHLISTAELERSFTVHYENNYLKECWEVKDCKQFDCPSYKSENLRCWQVAGTHCSGEVQGVFAQKLGKCEKCEVYKLARPDMLTELGEAFNNMMAMLEVKVEEQARLQDQLVQSTKLAAIGELAANIAHEINNPLTGVLTHASLMTRDLPGEHPNMENLQVITHETMRARDIVRNLLDFSRQERLSKRNVSIRNVMKDTLPLLRKQAELANVHIKLDYEDDVPKVSVDTNQMKQIFINILNNAIHAMPEGGVLTIGIKSQKPDGRRPWVEVSFADTGEGIPTEKMSRVFDAFYTSKDIGKGTGLGLTISKRIVEEHGGTIEVESVIGKGSIFTIKLPTANTVSDVRNVA